MVRATSHPIGEVVHFKGDPKGPPGQYSPYSRTNLSTGFEIFKRIMSHGALFELVKNPLRAINKLLALVCVGGAGVGVGGWLRYS